MVLFDATQTRQATVRAVIAGNPNCGKTCLFNALTGANQKVGNYPGVTVERREGRVRSSALEMTVVDLPGTYSLTALSADEMVARHTMLHERPDVVIDVVDAANLERNLYLTVQLMEMEMPLVVALNMVDVAERHGLTIDVERMAAVLGLPVVPTVGNRSRGIRDLLSRSHQVARATDRMTRPVTYGHAVDDEVDALAAVVAGDSGLAGRYPARWAAVKLLEKDEEIIRDMRAVAAQPAAIEAAAAGAMQAIESHFHEPSEVVLAEARYGFVAGIIRECVTHGNVSRKSVTDAVDAVVCHRLLGPLVLGGVVYLLFVAVFKTADEWHWLFGRSPTQWMQTLFAWLGKQADGLADTSPMLHSLLADGVIGGVGGIMAFVPLIFVMFALIAALEDTGYMARVAFVLDRALKVFGLQGKSIMAMIVSGGLGGGGCAVPGVLATRVLRDREDRLVTMLIAPLMNCGAKIPVYLMLIGAFFAERQAGMMFLLWLLSWVFALLSAVVIRKFVVRGAQAPFVMELPTYHVPTLRGVLRHTWSRTWMFIRKAGTLILATSVLLWSAMYFPRANTSVIDGRITALGTRAAEPEVQAQINALQRERQSAQLRHSVAGRAGAALENVTRWAGMDWRDNIALIGGFAAKEVIVSTLGVAYAMGDTESDAGGTLSAHLRSDPGWTPLRAFALMVFVMLYAPCVTVQIITRRESGSWKWPLFSMTYTTALGLLMATLIYQVGSAFGWGV
ncbi:MAG: ferrous iron transport protein B [Phycisphaerae bacterium]|nr:ferrous iron transport protein B [Phycisphaerae bacterium]